MNRRACARLLQGEVPRWPAGLDPAARSRSPGAPSRAIKHTASTRRPRVRTGAAVPLALPALQSRTVKAKGSESSDQAACVGPVPPAPREGPVCGGDQGGDPPRRSASGAPGSCGRTLRVAPASAQDYKGNKHPGDIFRALIVPEGSSEVESRGTGGRQDYRPGQTVCPPGALPGPPGPTARPPRCRRGPRHQGPGGSPTLCSRFSLAGPAAHRGAKPLTPPHVSCPSQSQPACGHRPLWKPPSEFSEGGTEGLSGGCTEGWVGGCAGPALRDAGTGGPRLGLHAQRQL